tara:strand:- start:5069 stop:5467 length:399 start_codon:yes stop_codon:yes gene_type:complete
MADRQYKEKMKESLENMRSLRDAEQKRMSTDVNRETIEATAKQAKMEYQQQENEKRAAEMDFVKSQKGRASLKLKKDGMQDSFLGELLADIDKRYPNNAGRIYDLISSGDLRYVSKEEFEPMRDKFDLIDLD